MRKVTIAFFALAGMAALLATDLALYQQNLSTALDSPGEVVITNFQQGHGFVRESSAGSQLDDPAEYALGEQSLRISTDGDGSAVFTRKQLAPALNFTDRVMKVWIKIDGIDNVSELRVSVTADDFRTWADYWISGEGADAAFLRENRWEAITLSPAMATRTGDPDISVADAIQVRVEDRDTGEPVTVWLNSIALIPKNSRPIVTFAFDDGYDSDYSKARPVLDAHHFPATSYVIGSMAGEPGRLSVEQMKALQEFNGWDIASHSYSHANMTGLNQLEIEAELSFSKEFLKSNGLYRGSEHFAYPYGEFDSELLRPLVEKYFSTARTVEGPTETLPPSDPYRLRVMVVTNDTSPTEVAERVQAAISGGDWLILVFHKIVDSAAALDTEYAKSDFEQIVGDIASRGVDVMTVSEVYADRFR